MSSKNPSSSQHHKEFLEDLVKILKSQNKDKKFEISKLNNDESAKIKQLVGGLKAENGDLGENDDGFLEKLVLEGGKDNVNKSRLINWKIVNHGKQTIIIL